MIYDDMDFSIYSLTELQSLYDRIDALDVDKKAFDSVNNKNKFMRQLKRYINDNAPKEEKENSFDLGTFISGNAFLIGGAIAIAICATVLTGGAAAPFVIAAAVGLAGGTASMFIGGAEIVESFTGDNYIKDGIFEGNEEKYNTAKTVVAITTAVATAVAAVPAIIANLTTTAVTTGTATGTATVKIVDTYANLKKTTAGMGLEVHHIVEKRFLPAINMANPNSMLSVALSKAEHQIYTNAWRAAFPYGQQVYGDIAKSELWKVAQKIYENFPELMEAAKQTIFN